MKSCTKNRTLRLLSVFLGLIVPFAPLLALDKGWARPYRVGKLPGSKLSCGACHVNPAGGGPRNSFGEDYAVIGVRARDRYTDELAARDSDGDGYTNAREFAAGTHPGDPNSKPAN